MTKPKRQRLTAADRAKLAATIERRYVEGASIRALAAEYGRSYGFIHGLLVDAEVPRRSRGRTSSRVAT